MMAGSASAKSPLLDLQVEHCQVPKSTTGDDHHMQTKCLTHLTPTDSSFEEEEEEEPKRGRKRRRTLDMAKRSAETSFGLKEISLPPSPATRNFSRMRSQSPSKTQDQLERCNPAVIHKAAGYQPQHPTTNARIKKFVQQLSDESGIFTASEKAYLEDEAQDWTQALRIPSSMLLESHKAKYPPLNWEHLRTIHGACELAMRNMQDEDTWTTAVLMPILQEALQATALKPFLVTSCAICSDYLPILHETTFDRKIDIVLGFEQAKYQWLGKYLLSRGNEYPRIHQTESCFPENKFIAVGLENKKFGSSGEGEAVVQIMVWAASMLKFWKTVLDEQWKRPRGQHKVPTLEDLPLLVVTTVVGDRSEVYVAYWEEQHEYLQKGYNEVIQGPFPVLSGSTSSLFNTARLVRKLQRLSIWAEEDFIHELLHVFGVDWAAVQRQEKEESIIYPKD